MPPLPLTNEGMTMTTLPLRITGGVDTHLDVHVAAAARPPRCAAWRRIVRHDTEGLSGHASTGWRSFGEVEQVGVEGTGSYGAGLTRHLQAQAVRVVEVDRPNRQRRRRRGKSDPQDAITVARAAQSGDAHGEAKTRDGNVEGMRVLRVARSSARKARTQALNQMRSLISTAPDDTRAELRNLNVYRLLEQRCSAFRPGSRLGDARGSRSLLMASAREPSRNDRGSLRR